MSTTRTVAVAAFAVSLRAGCVNTTGDRALSDERQIDLGQADLVPLIETPRY